MIFENLTLTQTVADLKSKKISLKELILYYQKQITKKRNLNIFCNLNPKLNNLQQWDTKGLINKPLSGAPITVKDNFCTQNIITTAATKILKKFLPPYESTVTEKLQSNGAFILGKTNLDAWAHGSSTETSELGPTKNPLNPQYLPGGSSGGSAASVSADLCLASIGSETAGSIRQPSAWCGVVGLKPTYGRVSRFGLIAMASSTDCPGPITKNVQDSAFLLNYLAGHDPKDATTSSKYVPNYLKFLEKSLKGLKIGLIYFDLKGLEKIKNFYQNSFKVLEKLGAFLEFSPYLNPEHAVSVYTLIQRAEVSSNLARFDGIRYGLGRQHFGLEAKRRIMLGTFALSKGYTKQYYLLAQKIRTLFVDDFKKLFTKYDILISPTSPGFAKPLGATKGSAMFGELEDMLLEPSSIAGLPGINLPCYQNPQTNLTLGLNIVGNFFREDLILKTAYALEQELNYRNKKI